MATLDDFMTARRPTATRPLLGLTILVVEDSRFASEAMRLLCLQSGARIRRADSLMNARRHLAVYRPTAIIVDMGLPDGSGGDLIADLSIGPHRIDVILGTSGDPHAETVALAAGADGFLAKPVASLSRFQAAILQHLPPDRQWRGPRLATTDQVDPDPAAYREDLSHAANLLDQAAMGESIGYILQFLAGVAESAGDRQLRQAVDRLAAYQGESRGALATLIMVLHERLRDAGPL